ncbi:hypothetical protein ACEU6E_06495 [Halorutilales archaeon Cl-col2-1]
MSTVNQEDESFIEKMRRDREENAELYQALAGNTDEELDHDEYDYLPDGYNTSSK